MKTPPFYTIKIFDSDDCVQKTIKMEGTEDVKKTTCKKTGSGKLTSMVAISPVLVTPVPDPKNPRYYTLAPEGAKGLDRLSDIELDAGMALKCNAFIRSENTLNEIKKIKNGVPSSFVAQCAKRGSGFK